jgi:hypothetical protein
MRILGLVCILAIGAHALSDHQDQFIFADPLISEHTSEAEQDRVTSLPGVDSLDFDLFAGQVIAT